MAREISAPDATGQEADIRTLTVSSCGGEGLGRPVPFIRIRGRYLEKAGFSERTRVHVTVTPGRIVLEPMASGDAQACRTVLPPMLVRMLMGQKAKERRAPADHDAPFSRTEMEK